MTDTKILEIEESYENLGNVYKQAIQECYKDVFQALKSTERPQPDTGNLYSELESPERGRKFFGRASVALADIGILELWNEGARNSEYRFEMSDMSEDYLEEAEQRIERLLET